MKKAAALISILIFIICMIFIQCTHKEIRNEEDKSGNPNSYERSIMDNAHEMMEKGKAVFRYETFGDEVFWTDKLQLHKAIADSKHGGNGAGLTPKDALAAGLKVDLAI